MRIRLHKPFNIDLAASIVGVSVSYNQEQVINSFSLWDCTHVRLRPRKPLYPDIQHHPMWQARSQRTARRVNAICIHGHGEFFRQLFLLDPYAIIYVSWLRVGEKKLTADNIETHIRAVYLAGHPTQHCDCN